MSVLRPVSGSTLNVRTLRCLLAVAGLSSGTPVLAETDVADRFMEEIVVTAEKRETTLQSLPLAVTALGLDELNTRGIDSIADLQFAAPGLVFNVSTDTPQVTIRGIGVDFTTIDSEPGVALYSDGVYRGGLVTQSSVMFDMERVEVVRGPQGTLNGRNSTGGSVNVISRLPGAESSVEVGLLYGDYDRIRAELAGDLPLSDVLAVRAAVVNDSADGWADNNFTGNDQNGHDYTVGKVALVYEPSDSLEFIVRAEATDSERTGPSFLRTADIFVPPLGLTISNPGGILTVPGTLCGPLSCEETLGLELSPGGVGSLDPQQLFADGEPDYQLDSAGISATVNWRLSDQLKVRSISSYFELENEFSNDIDGTEISATTNYTNSEIEEVSQELTLLGTSGDLDWIGGLFYYSSDIDEFYSFELAAFQRTFETIFGLFGGLGGPLPPGSLAGFGNRIDGTATPIPFLDNRMTQDTTSYAAYGRGTYNLSDDLRATVGLRYTRDRKEAEVTFLGNVGIATCVGSRLDESWSELTGKVGLDRDLFETTMIYGSVSRGYKAGGFNAGDCNDPYDPEILVAYEGGVKTQLLEGRMRLNVAAFFYDYSDIQARLFINNAASVQNASEAESYGAEIELNWLATSNFRIDGSVSLLHTEYQDHRATNPVYPQIGTDCDPASGLSCLQNIGGNRLLRAPEIMASLMAEYSFNIGRTGSLTLRGEYSYTDEVEHTIFNDELAREDGYSLANARIIWRPDADRMSGISVVGFVENLTDETYATARIANATTGGVQAVYAQPRTWGIQFRYGL